MRNLFLLTFVCALTFTGCGEGACCQGELVQVKEVAGVVADKTNKTPIATITNLPTTTANCRNAEANGDLSSDIDGTIDSYIWSIDGVNISEEKNPGSILPCENGQTKYKVCLVVIDDEGASSNQTCQDVVIIEQRSNKKPTKPSHVIPTIEIPAPFRDGSDYVFDVCNQTFDGHVVASYHWEVTKHFKGGYSATHTNNTCQKRIFAEIKEFESVDVTLTITFTDGHSNTTTNSYIQSDAPELN